MFEGEGESDMKALVSEKSVLFINGEIQFLWKMFPDMILSALLLFSTNQTKKINSQYVRFNQQFLFPQWQQERMMADLYWSYLLIVN